MKGTCAYMFYQKRKRTHSLFDQNRFLVFILVSLNVDTTDNCFSNMNSTGVLCGSAAKL